MIIKSIRIFIKIYKNYEKIYNNRRRKKGYT